MEGERIMRKVMKRVIALSLVCTMMLPIVGSVGTFEKNVTASEQKIEVSQDLNIEGYQVSDKLEGSRVIASVEPKINNKEVVNWGLVYALVKVGDKEFDVKDEEMFVGAADEQIASMESTELGTTNKRFGDSKTAAYYIRTMLFGIKNVKEFTARYKVRAYAKLSDGSYVYSEVATYSIYEISDKLYKGKKMNTKDGHNYLYHTILKLVNPDYKENDYDWSDVIVGKDGM